MSKPKTSLIWAISTAEFNELIKSSNTYKEVLVKLGFAIKSGGNYKTLKKRVQADNIDTSHIESNKKTFRGTYTNHKIPLEQIMIKQSSYTSCALKKRLLKEGILKPICTKCGLGTEWYGEPITLQLDHINGDNNDNTLENLRILCPNCHSQTTTYGSKNIKNSNKPKHTCNCGKVRTRGAKVCLSCWSVPTKITWPSNKELVERLKTTSYRALGKALGVSDNAIRKRLREQVDGIEPTTI